MKYELIYSGRLVETAIYFPYEQPTKAALALPFGKKQPGQAKDWFFSPDLRCGYLATVAKTFVKREQLKRKTPVGAANVKVDSNISNVPQRLLHK